jgi:hypothetical protein
VQRCKSERSSCGKVERWKYEKGAKRGTGDRKVSAGGGRVVRSRFGRYLANVRDAVAPLPAGGARERQLGWYAVPTLPVTRGKGSGNGA